MRQKYEKIAKKNRINLMQKFHLFKKKKIPSGNVKVVRQNTKTLINQIKEKTILVTSIRTINGDDRQFATNGNAIFILMMIITKDESKLSEINNKY